VRLGTVLVWIIYGLGIAAAAVFLLSAAVAGVVYLSSDDEASFGIEVSPRAVVVWGGLVVLAAATWLWRRRAGKGSKVRR
jgi:hypothetical protein